VTVQQLAPWASLLASLLTLVYVGVQEWRQYGDSTADAGRSLGQFAARLDTFVYTAITMLFVAALVHYALTFTSVTFLVVPVWLVAVFIVVATGATQAMPGEDFEDKLERADRDLRAESEATTAGTGDSPDREPAHHGRDSQDDGDE
jgi:fatty acid desaturase